MAYLNRKGSAGPHQSASASKGATLTYLKTDGDWRVSRGFLGSCFGEVRDSYCAYGDIARRRANPKDFRGDCSQVPTLSREEKGFSGNQNDLESTKSLCADGSSACKSHPNFLPDKPKSFAPTWVIFSSLACSERNH